VNALDFVECYDPAVEDAGLIDAALFVHSVITYEPDALVHGPQCKSRGSALKTANELVMEIGVAVQPPPGVAIVLTEEPGALPNWVAAAGSMEAALTDKFSEKVAEYRDGPPCRLERGRQGPKRVSSGRQIFVRSGVTDSSVLLPSSALSECRHRGWAWAEGHCASPPRPRAL
jgi:hypothetical protein